MVHIKNTEGIKMLKIILLLGYLMMGVYYLYATYTDSEIEIEDLRGVGNIVGMIIGALLWPLIWIVIFICACVEAYYNEED